MQLQMRTMWWKVVALVGITIVLLMVLTRIGWLVDERQGRQRAAEVGVAQAMAGAQVLLGPMLQRSCSETWTTVSGTGKEQRSTDERRDFTLSALPALLTVDGALEPVIRHRGLFKINGYEGKVTLQASWPTLAALVPRAEHAGQLSCEAPRMMVALSDARGLRAVQVRRGDEVLTVAPGTANGSYPRGLHAVLPEQVLDQPLQLQVALDLIGMTDFGLVPAAGATDVHLRSSWQHPSFGGRFLPVSSRLGPDGFEAHWQVSELATTALADALAGKALPQVVRDPEVDVRTYLAEMAPGGAAAGDARIADALAFSMVDPVNPYVMSDRAIKYGLMFIVLTFVCVALLEVLSARQVHPVQYLLVGLAMSLFFLLLLSLSEHLDFGLSYALAAGAAIGLLSAYGAAMLGAWMRGLAFGGLIAALYGVLFVLLSLEQAALLVGALLLFAVLAVVMMLTRRIDWYGLGGRALNAAVETR
ncbi:cell envelope integrity protein CreD [Roseateles amylovorans]|uniref:Cell envelope integrity protein CreD n=1 Tax=Roseateles amylovorans TaxID=2978473 RepID=A0ABY6AYT8_9BURK|nr:cell envelope integrity protein CreD [Roseateles amylovorans]UXH78341.1 cell envelope integrity protein CreD [Roseateles amylovorans]